VNGREYSEPLAKLTFGIFAGLVGLMITAMLVLFVKESLPFLTDSAVFSLFDKHWTPISTQFSYYGILPLLAGSVLVTVTALLIAIPLGLMAGVYLAEIAGTRERELLKPTIELIAGLPTVLLGFAGFVLIVPLVKSLFGLSIGLTALTGAVVLAFMVLPTIITISDEALRAIPSSYKHAGLALGGGRLQTILKVSIPSAKRGILAAILLGFSRAIGETVIVVLLTGNSAQLSLHPFLPVRTITATIFGEIGGTVVGTTHYSALFTMGLILFLLALTCNTIAYRFLNRTVQL